MELIFTDLLVIWTQRLSQSQKNFHPNIWLSRWIEAANRLQEMGIHKWNPTGINELTACVEYQWVNQYLQYYFCEWFMCNSIAHTKAVMNFHADQKIVKNIGILRLWLVLFKFIVRSAIYIYVNSMIKKVKFLRVYKKVRKEEHEDR